MRYIDREGNITTGDSGQDKLLQWMYNSSVGRSILRFLIKPTISKAAGWLLDKRWSKSCDIL